MIHMKCQDLFSSENKKNKKSSALVVVGTLKVKGKKSASRGTKIFLLTLSLSWLIQQMTADVFLIFPRKQDLAFHANCFHWRQSV